MKESLSANINLLLLTLLAILPLVVIFLYGDHTGHKIDYNDFVFLRTLECLHGVVAFIVFAIIADRSERYLPLILGIIFFGHNIPDFMYLMKYQLLGETTDCAFDPSDIGR